MDFRKKVIIFIMAVMILARFNIYGVKSWGYEDYGESKIDSYVNNIMSEGELPGVSVSVIKGDDMEYTKGYGYSDLKNKTQVTNDTLFELGSNSKAITGIAIMNLISEGKLDLEDYVDKYIPWFIPKYKGEEVQIKIKNLLYHTSGMSPTLITTINPSKDDNALEETVKNLLKYDLYCLPDEKYMYATTNYDVLGLIIEKITGEKYEEYVSNSILKKLGLNNSVIGRENSLLNEKTAIGYKCGFLMNIEYDAPVYRGNTPAAYVSMDGNDMLKWLKIQFQTDNLDEKWKNIIKNSQEPDPITKPTLDEAYNEIFRYAAGWLIFGDDTNKLISHGGNNPTYSSYIIVDPKKQIAIAVMSNKNSSYTYSICEGIYSILNNEEPKGEYSDIYFKIDKVCTGVIIFCSIVVIYLISRFYRLKKAVCAGIKNRRIQKKRIIITTIFWSVFSVGIGVFIYFIPKLFLWGYPWSFINIWGPKTTIVSLVYIVITIFFISIYRIVNSLYCKTTY